MVANVATSSVESTLKSSKNAGIMNNLGIFYRLINNH